MAKEPIDRKHVLGEVAPVVAPGQTFESVGDSVANIILTKTVPKQWYIGTGKQIRSSLVNSIFLPTNQALLRML